MGSFDQSFVEVLSSSSKTTYYIITPINKISKGKDRFQVDDK